MKTLVWIRRGLAAASLALTLAAFFCGWPLLVPQAGPSLLACFAGGGLAAILTVLALVLMTFLAGRVYCAVFCPLGILQDVFSALAFKKNRAVTRNFRAVRYAVLAAAILCGLFLGRSRIIEPYTLFGRIASGSGFLLAFIGILALLRRRVFCTTICPVGTCLGLIAKASPVQLRVNRADCVHCGLCAKACPAGCIDSATGRIDNERCIRCFLCLPACHKNAIGFGRFQAEAPAPAAAAPAVTNRRAFLCEVASGAVIGGAAGSWLSRGSASAWIYPPGALTAARFSELCTRCGLCVQHCEGKVLTLSPLPRLDFSAGMCEFNCTRCGDVCPTGALPRMPLATKKRWRIGLATFYPAICVAVQDGTDCGACAEHCPTGAVRMVPDAKGHRVPKLTSDLCIGCGNCEHPCPVRPLRAIRVEPIGAQCEAADPNVFFKKAAAPADASKKDDWLL